MALFTSLKLRLQINNCTNIIKRNKYFILLPEVPEDNPTTNLLLRPNITPPFSQLTTDHCIGAIGKSVLEHESGIHEFQEKLQDPEVPKNVQNIIFPLDQLTTTLDFAWGTLKLLNIVKHSDYTDRAYRKLYPRVVRAKKDRYNYPTIYRAFKELKAGEKCLTEPVQRIINKYLLESQLSGIDLPDTKKDEFGAVITAVEKHKSNYRRKLLECTNKCSHVLTRADNLDGLPTNLLQATAREPSEYTKGPWEITPEPHIYQCFLEHCSNRQLRSKIWHDNITRASADSGVHQNNSIEIEEIRHYRAMQAEIVGFKTFAEMSMKTKMAGSVENAMAMIHTLHSKSKDVVENDLGRLQDFASRNGCTNELQLWDIPFWKRQHGQELFKVDEAAVRQYFPFPTVLKGLLNFCEQMFDIKIMKQISEFEPWHEDVTFYKIYDQSGKHLSSFYIDPYARPESKLMGSFMEVGRNRSTVADAEPLSYLILNFQPPQHDKPSLLSYSDVTALFQKFGHILQHSLTSIPYNDVAGLTNLEWDAVDIVPHVFSNFLKDYSTVAQLSGHVDSGEPIPIDLHQYLKKAQVHMSSLHLNEQLYLSALDLDLYTRKGFWLEILRENWSQYRIAPLGKYQLHLCSFPTIFCDQYPAAYFSFLWAEMIAADVYCAFEEVGLDNKEDVRAVGLRFRDTYLALGGGCHSSEVFRRFRGRDPSTEALLPNYGILPNN